MGNKHGKILIVDDNRDIHEDIRFILDSSAEKDEDLQETRLLKEELFGEDQTTHGYTSAIVIKYRIEDAYQGDEAVDRVVSAVKADDPFSLIFMDIRMPPGIDGIEAIEQIWGIDPDVGVVICTAYSDYSWDQIVAKFGQNDNLLFIKKPFDNVSVKQIALAMTTKWNLKFQVKEYIENLEKQVEIRTNELTLMVDRLQKEIIRRKENERQLAYRAHYDSLTNLLNRRSFYADLSMVTSDMALHRNQFSIFYADLDDFKSVNDIWGHDIGDKLLIDVARRIESVMDGLAYMVADHVNENKTIKAIYRLGGDEFTIMIMGNDQNKIAGVAQKLIDAIKEPFIISGNEIESSCSIGISTCQGDDLPIDTLLKFADIALYEAKMVNGIYRFYNQVE